MKKQLLSSFAALLCCAAGATPVSTSQAEAYASAYLRNVLRSNKTVAASQLLTLDGRPAVHVVSLDQGGWVLIAADDVLEPIVGYSLTDSFIASQQMPAPVRGFLSGIADEIEGRRADKAPKSHAWQTDSLEINAANKAAEAGVKDKVEPLIQVNYNQSSYFQHPDYYPNYVGCVAVGMAQAMSYYKYPARPQGGSHSNANGPGFVNYDKEEPYDWKRIIDFSDDKVVSEKNASHTYFQELARLLYHCGVAVNMNYTPDGSGAAAFYGDVPKALRTYFGYSNKMNNVAKEAYTYEDWCLLLKKELSAGRPLIYVGYNSGGGHCFNVDGYDENNRFHFNWGWGGANNGYYDIRTHSYSGWGEKTTLNFAPPTAAPYSVTFSKNVVYKGMKKDDVVADITVDTDVDSVEWTFDVKGGWNILMKEYDEPDFYVEGGQLRLLNDIPANTKAKFYEANITVRNKANRKSLEVNVKFTVKAASEAAALTSISASRLAKVSAEKGRVLLSDVAEAFDVRLTSLSGQEIYRAASNGAQTVAIEGVVPGIYILSLSNAQNVLTQKVVVK